MKRLFQTHTLVDSDSFVVVLLRDPSSVVAQRMVEKDLRIIDPSILLVGGVRMVGRWRDEQMVPRTTEGRRMCREG